MGVGVESEQMERRSTDLLLPDVWQETTRAAEGGNMIIYCQADDCRHNEDGKCKSVWPNGVEAISLDLDWFTGKVVCTDYNPVEEAHNE